MAKGSGRNATNVNNKNKCKGYRSAQRLEHNKIKRILQSNGYSAALAYSKKVGIPMPKGWEVKKQEEDARKEKENI